MISDPKNAIVGFIHSNHSYLEENWWPVNKIFLHENSRSPVLFIL